MVIYEKAVYKTNSVVKSLNRRSPLHFHTQNISFSILFTNTFIRVIENENVTEKFLENWNKMTPFK